MQFVSTIRPLEKFLALRKVSSQKVSCASCSQLQKYKRSGPMEKTETESGNGNGKRKRKQKTETENGNGKLVMKWKRLHVVSCNNARASCSMLYIALASSVYSLDRTARQDSLKLQPFPCRTS